jgi:putative DNA primase/helicase
MTRHGLFRRPDDPEKQWLHVCGPLTVAAETRDADGRSWSVLLRWQDREGREHSWAMPRAMLAGDGVELRAHLLDGGLFLGPGRKAREALMTYLGAASPGRFVRVVPRLGWHDTPGGRVFVLPDRALGTRDGHEVILQTERPDAIPPLRQAGTLDQWKAEIAARAVGNSRLGFAIAAAFAAPLLGLLDCEGGGFHLRGASSIGKSTTLYVASSVWGGGGLRGWVRSWRTTDNALEAVAAAHCDLLLCLDEMSEAAPEAVAACANALANGAGKARAARDGSARRVAEWRLLFISSGEESLADRLAEARGGPRRVRAGQEVRVLDVPADTGRYGLFEELHGFADARALADALKAASGRLYGTAGAAWLQVLADDPAGITTAAREVIEAFACDHVPDDASGQVQRAARRFALVAAAGELAIGAGILPWPPGEAERAAAACFAAWRDGREAGSGRAEDAAAIAAVRRFLIAHASSRFETIGPDDEASGERIVNRAGWRRRDADGWRYIIPGEVWRGEVVAGLDPEAAARACRRAGFLVPQSEAEPRNVRVERINGRLTKAYVIRETILGGDA